MKIRANYNAASNLGTLYYFEGLFAPAAAAFREALQLEQARYEIWGNLAHTFEILGRDAEAAEAFRQARDLVLEILRRDLDGIVVRYMAAHRQQVVAAVMSTEQTLQAAIAVRDKVVAAYQEISRMAI